MAKPYPILPLSVLDELHDLNGALDAYQELMTAWIQQTMTEGPSGDRQLFAAGCQFLLRPILEGYQDIERQAKAFESMGFVGVGYIDPQQTED
ncbi:hypothetical protein D3C78_682340 [compost metagenome]